MPAKRFRYGVSILPLPCFLCMAFVGLASTLTAQTTDTITEIQLPWEAQAIQDSTPATEELPSLPFETTKSVELGEPEEKSSTSTAELPPVRPEKKQSLTIGWNMTKLQAAALQKGLERDGYKNSTIQAEGAGHSIIFRGLSPEEAEKLQNNLRAAGYQPLRVSDLPDAPEVRRKRAAQLNAKGRYSVSVEFDSQQDAEAAVEQMARDGYPRGEIMGRGRKHEVRLGGVEKQEEAALLRDNLTRDGYNGVRVLTGNQEVRVGDSKPEKPMQPLTAAVAAVKPRPSPEMQELRQQVQSLAEEVSRLRQEISSGKRQDSHADETNGAAAGDSSKGESLFFEVRVASGVDEEERDDLVEQLKRDGYSDISADSTKAGQFNVVLFGFPSESDAEQAASDLMRRGYQFGSVKAGKIVRARYADKPAPLPAENPSE